MINLELSTRLPQALIILLLVLVLYSMLFAGKEGPAPSTQEPECIDGQRLLCSIGQCNGTRECISGSWSDCVWDVICTPGVITACEGACAQGYRVCNPCGSGYGPCTSGRVG